MNHLLINSGTTSNALKFYSSSDAIRWSFRLQIKNSSKNSQADGVLSGSRLYIVYPTSNGQLELTTLNYRRFNDWRLLATQRLTNSSSNFYDRPSIAIDGLQRLWIAAPVQSAGSYGIALFVIEGQDSSPRFIGLFGTINESQTRSARLLKTPGGLLMLYTDRSNPQSEAFALNFVHRLDSAAVDAAWSSPQQVVGFATSENDVYGVHFNAAVDLSGNTHVVTRANDALLYAKIVNYQLSSGSPRVLNASSTAPYPQVSIGEAGGVYITFPFRGSGSRELRVLTSLDQGANFTLSHLLQFRNGQNFGEQRIEAPSAFKTMLPVVQQVSNSSTSQGLVGFPVLVPSE